MPKSSAPSKVFQEFYSSSLLELLGCPIESVHRVWIFRIVAKGKTDVLHHPIRHLLMMHFLGFSAEEFFTSFADFKPFVGRPYPCLNRGSDHFGEMIIDCNITRRCTEEAGAYRSMETFASSIATPVMRGPLTPDPPALQRHTKQVRLKALKHRGTSSGYSTDTGSDDHYALVPSVPHLPYRNAWTPANTPRSVVDTRLPSPREIPIC